MVIERRQVTRASAAGGHLLLDKPITKCTDNHGDVHEAGSIKEEYERLLETEMAA